MMTAVKLSDRLQAVADMVTPGLVLADIGTDHAYIPIYLIEQEVIPRAIAMDVHEGPLLRAKTHIQEHGLSDRIETRLSDGLATLRPGEAQSIVLAGMGGALTIRILENAGAILNAYSVSSAHEMDSAELILQPQSEIQQVRAYLARKDWRIVREDMVFEDGKYYPMMKARWISRTATGEKDYSRDTGRESGRDNSGDYSRDTGKDNNRDISRDTSRHNSREYNREYSSREYSQAELAFGPRLLQMRHPVLKQYLLRERLTQERILESLKQGRTEKTAVRIREVQNQIDIIDKALNRYVSA
ncbi:MAG: tRNA (adenine(22)-N(1))-methyltransferase TrmK [Lachnospiraceae bacterium]|nr:tRNA (adenine(22)-N(1))-methyltransferase TrmK [Lachnospiraceae bacterium]